MTSSARPRSKLPDFYLSAFAHKPFPGNMLNLYLSICESMFNMHIMTLTLVLLSLVEPEA